MKLFVFKTHEKCLEHDSMILVVAGSPEKARQHILSMTIKDTWPPLTQHVHNNYCICNDLLVDTDGVVSLVKTDHQEYLYHPEWYLAEEFDLKDEYAGTEGVRSAIYTHYPL